VHPRGDPFVFGPETRRITGTDRLREDVSGTAFLISPTAFFQTNVKAAEILVRLVLDAVPITATVLDLYAGSGLFALPLAHRGHQVVAVEANPAAVADGEASLRLNRIPDGRCRFIARPVDAVTRRSIGADAVVLDPPREGCEASVLDDVFGRIRPATAVYVSCHPETLARDLTRVVRHGYEVRSLQPVDMFPHTPHVETVVVIARG
jgi:23S rRNA (uracil1939-C5)-methyltransferase